MRYTSVSDSEIFAPVVDYSDAYPSFKAETLSEVSYAELKSGRIKIKGKQVPTASLSSYSRAVEIATTLKEWILNGKFQLAEPVEPLPSAGSDVSVRPFNERPID